MPSDPHPPTPTFARLERHVAATPEQVWEAWTTAAGIESWWAPDGFAPQVLAIDVRVGGELRHTLTATEPGQIAFLEQAGLPLTSEATKTFTELDEPRRLAYTSLVDFVPGTEPYAHRTVVELTADGAGTQVVMAVDPMHDDVWSERMLAGRTNELENLVARFA